MPPRIPLLKLIASSSRATSSRTFQPPQPLFVRALPTIPQSRQFHSTPRSHASNSPNRPPFDASIPYTIVQLVSPETEQLTPPTPLHTILESYDLSTHIVVLVSVDPPIVRIHNREEYEAKLRDTARKSTLRKKIRAEEKEVQVSWTSAQGDLDHKIELAKRIVSEGDRVTVLFAIKGSPRRDKMTDNQKMDMVQRFVDGMKGVAKKWQDDDVKGKAVALHFEPMDELRVEVVAKVTERELEGKKEKEERKEARRRRDEERRLAASKKT